MGERATDRRGVMDLDLAIVLAGLAILTIAAACVVKMLMG